jgi:hypothetical protein
MQNGAPDDGCVCHRYAVAILAGSTIKPRSDPSADVRDRFTTVGSRVHVRQPYRDRIRLLGPDIAQTAGGPASIVAVAQIWIDDGRKLQCSSRLPRRQRGAGPTPVNLAERGHGSARRRWLLLERFIQRKCRSAGCARSGVANQGNAGWHDAVVDLSVAVGGFKIDNRPTET